MTLTAPEFQLLGDNLAASLSPSASAYWRHHAPRLWDSYTRAAAVLPAAGAVISPGAGPAYVEAALVRSHGARSVVVDFPEAVEGWAAHYERAGLEPIAQDLTTSPGLGTIGTDFDLGLSLEIVEHLPTPPSQHIGSLASALKRGGALLVSTPNAGNLRSIMKTVLHRPTLPSPELTFAPVGHENEGVHRREYMRREIEAAFIASGLRVKNVGWVSYGRTTRADAVLLPVERLVPKLRRTMSILGVRD